MSVRKIKIFSILLVGCILLLFTISGCGGGGGGGEKPPTTGTITGRITLPANTNAKIFETKRLFYAKIFYSIAYADVITDLSKLIVKVGNVTTNPDAQGNYTITIAPGTNIEIIVTAPSGNVVLKAIVPQLTAGGSVTQDIDTTTTAIAMIYNENKDLSISQIESATSLVENVKTAIETALTDTNADSIINNATVKNTAQTSATTIVNNKAPVISLLSANPNSVNTGEKSTITCTASDTDGDNLIYSWTKTGGSLSSTTGNPVTWTAPNTTGTYTITCTVIDGKGGSDTKSVEVTVISQLTGSISGIVTLEGVDNYSGAKVEIEGTGLSATTSSNGAYSISNIPLGTYTVTASKDLYESKSQKVVITEIALTLTGVNFNLTFKQQPDLPPTVTLSSITISCNKTTLNIQETVQFKAEGKYSDNITRDITSSVTWSSSNTQVGTISNTGLFTAEGVGTTNVVATKDGKTSNSVVIIVQGLISDFQPCSGKPTNPQSFPETERLLLATSDDGLTFTRTNTILSDRGTVPDAVVLNSGRILVYYVAACIKENGVEKRTNETVVAVSDNNGANWVYKKVTFNGVPLGATSPVDPNVVLKPDGTLRMFATVDPDAQGSQKARTYSFVSTDGGFTYTSEGERFSVSSMNILDPENFRFSNTNWKIWAGTWHATSTDGNNFTSQGPVSVAKDSDGYSYVIAEITDFSTTTPFYRMYVHGGNPTPSKNTQIKSLTSTDSTNWTLEAGARLTLDTNTGKESTALIFPTVVKLKNGTYLMVYETTIP